VGAFLIAGVEVGRRYIDTTDGTISSTIGLVPNDVLVQLLE
jgi:hypothetical protein